MVDETRHPFITELEKAAVVLDTLEQQVDTASLQQLQDLIPRLGETFATFFAEFRSHELAPALLEEYLNILEQINDILAAESERTPQALAPVAPEASHQEDDIPSIAFNLENRFSKETRDPSDLSFINSERWTKIMSGFIKGVNPRENTLDPKTKGEAHPVYQSFVRNFIGHEGQIAAYESQGIVMTEEDKREIVGIEALQDLLLLAMINIRSNSESIKQLFQKLAEETGYTMIDIQIALDTYVKVFEHMSNVARGGGNQTASLSEPLSKSLTHHMPVLHMLKQVLEVAPIRNFNIAETLSTVYLQNSVKEYDKDAISLLNMFKVFEQLVDPDVIEALGYYSLIKDE